MIGSFGLIIFAVSSFFTLTPEKISRKFEANYANHDLIKGKPRKELIGTSCEKIDLNIKLRADMCRLPPRLIVEQLRDMCRNGEANHLVIGGIPVSEHPLVIMNVSDEFDIVYKLGRVYQISVSLSLEEYR